MKKFFVSTETEKIILICSLMCVIIFLLFLRFSGLNIEFAVNIQNYFLKTALLQTSGMSIFSSIAILSSVFIVFFAGFVFLMIGLGILCAYSFENEKIKHSLGLLTGLISGLFALFLFNFSIISFFLALAIIITCYYTISFADTYRKELKKWIYFRTGSKTANRILFIFNIIIATGVFFSVLSGNAVYQQDFQKGISDSMKEISIGSMNLENMSPEYQTMMKQEINKSVSYMLKNSPIIESYIRWLPVSTAFGVWIGLEFLRFMLLSNIAGLFTTFFIRIRKKKQ